MTKQRSKTGSLSVSGHAKALLSEHGHAARAFAHARASECFYYTDPNGEAYWLEIEHILAKKHVPSD